MKDRIFCKWKERFFILTDSYLICLKEKPSIVSDIGELVFKVLIDLTLIVKKKTYRIFEARITCFKILLTPQIDLEEKAGSLTPAILRAECDLGVLLG